ncbi:MAG: DUF2846 domain-containing protein [Terracidiphilus sp.]|jgi:hypothetical protein
MLKWIAVPVFAFALASLPVVAQATAPASGEFFGCGPENIKFDVKFLKSSSAAPLEPGKARVYFLEEDINLRFITHTSRIDVDGKPMGATHGDSYFYFSVDPGVHHLCATTQFGVSSDEASTGLLHFTAEAGGVYYFEMKNLSWPEGDAHDVSFLPLDSDQGEYLVVRLAEVTSRQKK